jgi:hypothetical protein
VSIFGGPLVWLIAALAQAAPSPASLAGFYDGGQTEMAAGLELKEDGRFRYALSYGALDEGAEGRWTVEGNRVVLTSDPFKAPRIAMAEQRAAPAGELIVTFGQDPQLPPQLFMVEAEFASGRTEAERLGEDGARLNFPAADPPLKVRLLLPMFDVTGETMVVDPVKGYWLSFVFEPNELGKVDFRATPLEISDDELLLKRHDRLLRFRKAE